MFGLVAMAATLMLVLLVLLRSDRQHRSALARLHRKLEELTMSARPSETHFPRVVHASHFTGPH